MRAPLLSLAVASLAALAACADSTPTAPLARRDLTPLRAVTSVTEPASGPWARIVEGETGPGSLYAIYVPRTPNQARDVVFYAHGFRDAPGSIDLRDQDSVYAVRDKLGEMGFTVAYSSYSENGLAVKDGVQRTHQLRGLVASELGGLTGRSFLVGHSLGGIIGLQLAEQYPEQYAGALLMCGMVGGSLVQTQYVGNVRALVDFFFPGAFPGAVLTAPEREITAAQVQAYFQPLLTSPDPVVRATTAAKLLAIASTKEAPLPFVAANLIGPAGMMGTVVGSVAGALNFHSRGIANILDLTNGHSPFDNMGGYTVGTPLLDAATLAVLIGAANAANTGVPRVAFDPSAENYLARHYTPTGRLGIPVLTVHNAWDPGVPAFHQTKLLAAVEGAGATDKLVQWNIRFRGSLRHCDINPGDAIPAFQALVTWVSSGQKPTN